MSQSTPSFSMPHSRRLHGKEDFARVFDGKMRKSSGPIVFWAIPNELGYPRMGLSVSRRVGNAVKRNRIKRMLREAFRTTQHEWPHKLEQEQAQQQTQAQKQMQGYDMVLAVRGHEPVTLEDYQFIFRQAMTAVHQQWEKRRRKTYKPEAQARPWDA